MRCCDYVEKKKKKKDVQVLEYDKSHITRAIFNH